MEFSNKLGGVAVATLLVAAAACQPGGGAPGATATGGGGGSKGTLKIGVELPLSGGEAPNGQPTVRGVRLAVDEVNKAGGIGGYTLAINEQDDAVNGKNNPEQGAKNMTTLVNDQDVVAVVGPFNSAVAKAQIPISNEAGVLQCSPANTNPDLTKTREFRPKNPDKINYIRVATTDDVQGPAGAAYMFNDLGVKSVLVVHDVTTFGQGVAETFQTEFKRLGGTVTDFIGADKNTTDFVPLLTAAKAKNPGGVYYGGVTTSGGGLLRKQMPQAGLDPAKIPLGGPDGIQDGPATTQGSFLNIAGDARVNTHSTVAAIGEFPAKADFDKKFEALFANDGAFAKPGAYSGPAYACTQVIIQALRAVVDKTDKAGLREAIRAHATGGNEFDTILGKIKFDQNGDTSQKIISFYKEQGGNWAFAKQQDFGQTTSK